MSKQYSAVPLFTNADVDLESPPSPSPQPTSPSHTQSLTEDTSVDVSDSRVAGDDDDETSSDELGEAETSIRTVSMSAEQVDKALAASKPVSGEDDEETETSSMNEVFNYLCPHGHGVCRHLGGTADGADDEENKFRCEICDAVFTVDTHVVGTPTQHKVDTSTEVPPLTIVVDATDPNAPKTDETAVALTSAADDSAASADRIEQSLRSPTTIVIPVGRHNRLIKTIFGFTLHCKCLIDDEVRMTVWILTLILVLIGTGFFIAYVDLHTVTVNQLQLSERYIAILIAGIFAFLACVLTIVQVRAHYMHWVHPASQKCVVRILIMVPVYSISAWLSLVFLDYSLYFDFCRSCYEAFVIYSFLILLTKYLGGHAGVSEWMKNKPPQHWPPPWCCFPSVSPGSTFLYWLKYGTLQYTIINPIISVLAMILNVLGFYHDGETSATDGYIYIAFIQNISQLTALYCLVWLYHVMKNELAPFSPMAKFLVVKSVVFLTWWQGIMIAFLVSWSIIQSTGGLNVGQIEVGLQDFLVCIEMFIAASVHKYTFGYETYANGTMQLLMEERQKYLQEQLRKRATEEFERQEKEDARRRAIEEGDRAYYDTTADIVLSKKKKKKGKRVTGDYVGGGRTVHSLAAPPPLSQPTLLSVLSKGSSSIINQTRNAVKQTKFIIAPVTSLLQQDDDDLLFDEEREHDEYARIIADLRRQKQLAATQARSASETPVDASRTDTPTAASSPTTDARRVMSAAPAPASATDEGIELMRSSAAAAIDGSPVPTTSRTASRRALTAIGKRRGDYSSIATAESKADEFDDESNV